VREQDIAQLNSGYFSAVDELIGMELTRSLQGGMVLNPAMLQRPRLIARGDRVSIEVRSSQLQVRMAGQALADGAAGERIQVRNLSSKRVVEGEVVAPGVVHVGTPTTD
jgi:flagella basal body P-ring formation protein FlgA